MRAILLLLLWLSTVGTAVARPPALPQVELPFEIPTMPERLPDVLTVDDAVNIALARSPFLKAALARIEAAGARVAQNASPLLPQVNASAFWTRTEQPLGQPIQINLLGQNVLFQTPPQFITISKAEVTVRQLISDGGRLRRTLESSISGALAVKDDVVHGARQLIYQVKKAYLDVLQAESLVEVAEKGLEDALSHKTLAEKAFKAGTVARADVVLAEVPVAQSRLQIERAKAGVQRARVALNTFLGAKDLLQNLTMQEQMQFISENWTLEQAQSFAREHRADLQAARSRVKSAERAVRAAEAARSVNIGLGGGYGWTGYNQEIIPIHEGWNITLNVTYAIFDGHLNSFKVMEAKATQAELEALQANVEDEIRAQVTQAWLGVELSRKQLELNKAELDAATERVRIASGQYRTGVGTLLSVQDAEVALLQALTNQAQLKYAIWQALLQLELAIGMDSWEDAARRSRR